MTVGALAVEIELKIHFFLALFVAVIGFVSFRRCYSKYNAVEHVLMIILFMAHKNISFSMFQAIKVFVSFIFFLVELVVFNPDFRSLQKLRFLIGDFSHLCHANVSIGESTYDYRTKEREAGGSKDRSYQLQPNKRNRTTTELSKTMFWSPCVGFSLEYSEENLLQRLSACGKCHEWAAVAVYLLSTHKFLSYSSLAYVRWMNWICFVLAMILLYLRYFLNRFLKTDSNLPDNLNDLVLCFDLILWAIVDCAHMLITLLDILNFKASRLEDNALSSSKIFHHRGILLDTAKLIVLYSLVACWCYWGPSSALNFSYIVYLTVCFFVGLTVHLIVSNMPTSDALAFSPTAAKITASDKSE